jgi:hypothetical protein
VAESRWQVASAITLVNTGGKEVMKNLDSGVHLNDGNVTRNDLLDTILGLSLRRRYHAAQEQVNLVDLKVNRRQVETFVDRDATYQD